MEIDWRVVSAIAIFFPLLLLWQSKSKRNKFDGSPDVLWKLAAGLAIVGIIIVTAAGSLFAAGVVSADDAVIYGFVCGGICFLMALIVFRHYLNAKRDQGR